MLKLVFLSLLFSSCSKFYDVEKEKGLYVVKQLYSEVDMAKEVEWMVGRKKEVSISKGVRFSFTIPKISDHGRVILKKKYGVDSWIYRVSKISRGTANPIGFFYYPFSGMTQSTRNYTVNLYYHAAAVGKRFRLFHCPAFNHRSKIGSVEIEDRSLAGKSDVYVRDTMRVPAKVHRIHITPMIFSTGRLMQGKYVVDYAFYNSENKHRYSNWIKVDKTVVVTQENAKSVPSCIGIKEELNPLPESRMPNIRDLEIK